MDVVLTPAPLSGSLTAPPSKSAAHRAAICAMLARGKSTVAPVQQTDDMLATASAARALGASVQIEGNTLAVSGISPGQTPVQAVADCNESGSTLRFFIPIAAALGVETLFRGHGKLPARPLTPLVDALSHHGVACRSLSGHQSDILQISGRLHGGLYEMPGDISSQYITGLLFALPLLSEDSEIRLTSPLQSRGYVDMTLFYLGQAGIEVNPVKEGWRIPGKQHYSPGTFRVEGDYSSAAFWLCAGALGAPVEIGGLDPASTQGDKAILDALRSFGADISMSANGAVRAAPGPLQATTLDVSQIPDLAPVLAVVAACARGETVISGAARLRIKESDRIHSTAHGLRALGVDVQEHADKLVIQGRGTLTGGVIDSFNDHRIAMAFSIASIRCAAPVKIIGANCVAKSYLNFYDHFKQLGGIHHVI